MSMSAWSSRIGSTASRSNAVLVANRLCAPSSEHGLARWLETDFVCDRQGRRWVPQWRDDGERRASRSPRVRVAAQYSSLLEDFVFNFRLR